MSRKSFFGLIALLAAAFLAAGASIGAAQSSAQQGKMPEETGLLVVSVYPGSPADKAGISRGDIILSADGKNVNLVRDLYGVVASHKSGDTLSLTIKHGDAQRSLTATLAERDGRAYLGLVPYPAGGWFGRWQERRDDRRPMGAGPGAFIESVVKGSPADKAGLKEGEIIVSVDGVNVGIENSLAALVQKHKIGDTVTLSVRDRDKGPRDVKVVLEKNPQNTDMAYLGVQYNPRLFGPSMMGGDRRFDGPRGYWGPMRPWGRGSNGDDGPTGMMPPDSEGPDSVAPQSPDAQG
jgi:membrane-associated protease RseP (regulator of RpoE activity)